MAHAWSVAGATAASAASAALVVALVSTPPAYSSPAAVNGPTTAPPTSPAPTETTPLPSPSPTATATPTGPADDLLRPDVVALRAHDLVIQVRSDGRRLRFTSALGNVGSGPLEVRPNQNQPCPAGQHNSTQIIYRDANGNGKYFAKRDTGIARRQAGCMVFHPFHNHWHFKASARYTLLDPSTAADPVVVSARRKVSFCLRDSARVPGAKGTSAYPQTYGACARRTPQGISVGWMDIYQSFLAGQYLPLPKKLEDGIYCLHTVVDPLDQLTESDNDNNSSMRELAVRGNRVVPRPNTHCL